MAIVEFIVSGTPIPKKKVKIEPVRDSERVVRTENVFVRCESLTRI